MKIDADRSTFVNAKVRIISEILAVNVSTAKRDQVTAQGYTCIGAGCLDGRGVGSDYGFIRLDGDGRNLSGFVRVGWL